MPAHLRPTPRLVLTAIGAFALPLLVPTQAQADPTPAPPTEQQQAQQAGKPVTIDSLTDEHSTTAANPDGTFTLITSRNPRFVKDDGTWHDVDTTLVLGADGRYRPTMTPVTMSFSSGGTTPLAITTLDDHTLSLTLPFALPTPVPEGNALTYPGVLPDVDLVVHITPESFSEVLVVKNERAAQNPALDQLKLQVHTTNLTLKVNPDGSTKATDSTGAPVFTSPAPTSWDSSSTTAGTSPDATTTGDNQTPIDLTTITTTKINNTTTRTDATLTPESDTAPTITYPLYIDPSFSAARANFRTTITGQTGYGNTSDYMRVGYCGWVPDCSTRYTTTFTARSYVEFLTPTLAPRYGTTATIISASFSATLVGSSSSSATPIELHRATAFTQSTAWPGPMGDLIQSVSAAGAGAAVRYDNSALTAYLQQAATAGSTSINFGLKAGSESDKYQYKKVANNPLLTITYAFPVSAPRFTNITNTVTCDSALYVNTPTPTFSAAATDYNISPGNIRIDHQIRKSDNTIAAQGSRVEPPASLTPSHRQRL